MDSIGRLAATFPFWRSSPRSGCRRRVQFPHKFQNGKFFGLCLDVNGKLEVSPAVGEIGDGDEVVMTLGLGAAPALDRTGDVKERLAVPCTACRLSHLLNGKFVPMTAVMMDVVYQRDPRPPADGQQVVGGVGGVVVLDRQSLADPAGELFEIPLERVESGLLVAVGAPRMNIHDIGPNPFRDLGLVFEFPHGSGDDLGSG